jgi:single-stranded DNA-binding protein
MTAHVLASGAFYRDSEQHASKSDKPFIAVTLRARDGDATLWRKVIVFYKTARAEFLRLTDGDAVAVQGALRVEKYERAGETKLSLAIFADQLLTDLRFLRRLHDLRNLRRRQPHSSQRILRE